MDYFEFVSAGSRALVVVTRHRDPARMPDAARACCPRWEYARAFRLGDGSHTAAEDAAIQAQVAAVGYALRVVRGRDGPAATGRKWGSKARRLAAG